MKTLGHKMLVTGIGTGPALRRVEAAWEKLSTQQQINELPVWLEAARNAAQIDGLHYETIDESVFLFGGANCSATY